MPQSITAGIGGGATLQDNSYLFDPVGNLTQRQNIISGTTESVYPDSLNRLDHTVGDTNTTMTYDALGRIASWEAYGNSANVNDYSTPQSGCTYYVNVQPHAARKSTQGSSPPTSFCYDANGNMTTQSSSGSADRIFTWTSFNQPSAITAPGYNSYSQFLYDENHQRFEQIASYSGSAEDTEYIGALMEKMTNSTGTTYRYYVPAGNNFIVYNRWTNGTNAIDYATRDHIGSTAVITDSSGALVVAEKFSALGWGEGNGAIVASVTRHEFTGQEALDNYGLWLVDMNGRIYNSSGAYFFSPDPYIQDPTNTQNYDRYSYVDNNPLSYNDPTGFCGFSVQSTYIPGGEYPTSDGGLGVGVANGYWTFTFVDSPCDPPAPPGFLGGHGSNGGTSSGQTPSPNLLPQQTMEECLAGGGGASGESDGQQELGYADEGGTALEGATDAVTGGSALEVGKAFAGSSPFGVLSAPTNAGYEALGSQVQSALGPVATGFRYGGYFLGALSVGVDAVNGYNAGGLSGGATDASLGLIDFGVEATLSAGGPLGALAAIGYSATGGSKALAEAAGAAVMCSEKLGVPPPMIFRQIR